MESVEILDAHETADGVLALRKRGAHFDIVLGRVVLLSSAALGTEIAFGELVHRANAARVLIGGLGFGGTARGALSVMPKNGELVICERMQVLERWLRGPLAHIAHNVLDDPRVRLVNADVFDLFETERPFAAILLDVDNGPDWASFRTNARLYAPEGLRRARQALSPDGLYAVWSGYDAPAFVGALRRAGFTPETVPLHEGGVVQARAYVGRMQPGST
jgi:predicted membrane-bound spermidine synthase